MSWPYYMPTWLLGSLIVALYAGFAGIGHWLVDRRLKPHGSNNLVSDTVRSVVACYSILLGLTAVTAWDNFKQVQANVAKEAYAVADLFRDVEAFSGPDRIRLQSLLRTYVRIVITEEWPAQQQGRLVDGATPVLNRFTREHNRVGTGNQVQAHVHAATTDRLEMLQDSRRTRRMHLRSGLHPMMWFVVIAGGIIAIGLNWFYFTDHRRLKLALNVTLAATIGLVVFWIFALDHPLWGQVSVPNDRFLDVLRDVMGEPFVIGGS